MKKPLATFSMTLIYSQLKGNAAAQGRLSVADWARVVGTRFGAGFGRSGGTMMTIPIRAAASSAQKRGEVRRQFAPLHRRSPSRCFRDGRRFPFRRRGRPACAFWHPRNRAPARRPHIRADPPRPEARPPRWRNDRRAKAMSPPGRSPNWRIALGRNLLVGERAGRSPNRASRPDVPPDSAGGKIHAKLAARNAASDMAGSPWP